MVAQPAALVGQSKVGSGLITGPGTTTIRIEGLPVALVGDTVASHGGGAHAHATLTQGSSTVFYEGRAVVYEGALASCGHAVTLGSTTVKIGT